MARYLLKGAKVLTLAEQNPVIDDGALIINDDSIEAVGKQKDLLTRGPFDSEVGSSDFIVMPGLNNAHYHCGSGNTIRAGVLDARLETWLLTIHGALMGHAEGEAGEDALYTATQYFGCQMIKSGITSCIDNIPPQLPMSDYGIGAVVKAYTDLGLRVSIAPIGKNQCAFVYGNDEDFLATLPGELAQRVRDSALAQTYVDEDEYISILKSAHGRYDGTARGRIKIFLSPYGPQWTSDSMFRKIKQTAGELNTGIQLHLLETRYEMQYALKTYGKTAIAHLEEIGFLGEEVSCAHTLWVTDDDLRILADTGAICVHNPVSNLRLGSGIARVKDMMDAGVRLALGTDGMGFAGANDMLNDLRLAYYLQRLPGLGLSFIDSMRWLKLATKDGARAIGLDEHWGTLEPGKKADVVLVNLKRIAEVGMDKNALADILLQYVTNEDVDTVIVNGETVMRGGRVLTVDEEALAEKLKAGFETLQEEFNSKLPLMQELEPYAEAFFCKWDKEQFPVGYQYNTQ